jgi:hypoxanthine phosphoribosyltransferase
MTVIVPSMKANKVYYTPQQINSYILTIARQMYSDQFHPEYIIGLSRGGLVPAIKLSHYLNIPMYALNKEESNLWLAEDVYNGVNMLIIDDINDTGKTIQWVKQDFRSSCMPKDEKWETIWTTSARFAVCIDNEASNEFVSYSGHTINKFENPEWCVFPWEEWWVTT